MNQLELVWYKAVRKLKFDFRVSRLILCILKEFSLHDLGVVLRIKSIDCLLTLLTPNATFFQVFRITAFFDKITVKEFI